MMSIYSASDPIPYEMKVSITHTFGDALARYLMQADGVDDGELAVLVLADLIGRDFGIKINCGRVIA